jgi:hypothetical protein
LPSSLSWRELPYSFLLSSHTIHLPILCSFFLIVRRVHYLVNILWQSCNVSNAGSELCGGFFWTLPCIPLLFAQLVFTSFCWLPQPRLSYLMRLPRVLFRLDIAFLDTLSASLTDRLELEEVPLAPFLLNLAV